MDPGFPHGTNPWAEGPRECGTEVRREPDRAAAHFGLRLGGAGFLLAIGVSALRGDPLAGSRSQRDPEGLLADFASAFALTISNPITILAFLAIFAAVGFSGAAATLGRAAILVLGVWLGSLLWWGALAFGAGMLRLTFERRHLVWVNRGSGGILVLSGIALL